MKIKVGVIFGGETVEHEVSIITAVQAMEHMNKDNIQWLDNLFFVRSKDFLDTFIDNMDKNTFQKRSS